MSYQDFTQFPVWTKGHTLVLNIFRITNSLPDDEKFALISDMRRAAYSITNNIAEGFGRHGKKDKTRFYKISRGSAYELINQLHICEGIEYIDINTKNELISYCKIIISELNKIIKTLETR